MTQVQFMGKLVIPVVALKEVRDVEQWYPLFPRSSKETLGVEDLKGGIKYMLSNGFEDPQIGTIRIKLKYTV